MPDRRDRSVPPPGPKLHPGRVTAATGEVWVTIKLKNTTGLFSLVRSGNVKFAGPDASNVPRVTGLPKFAISSVCVPPVKVIVARFDPVPSVTEFVPEPEHWVNSRGHENTPWTLIPTSLKTTLPSGRTVIGSARA